MNINSINIRITKALTVALLALLLSILPYMSHTQNSINPYKDILRLNSFDELKYPYEVKYAELPGKIRLAYVDEGKGDQTIIFIHGLGSYLKSWQKNIEGLKDHYRCIAIDLPGYGKSSKAPHSGMMSFYAGVISDLIDELNLKNVVIAGHSMGGQIAMMFAVNYPYKVQKLILAAPAGFEEFNKGQKQWFRDVMTVEGVYKTTVEQIQTNLAYNFYNVPADAEFMITDRIAMRSAEDFEAYCYAVVRSVNGMVDEPVIDILKEIKHPALILYGEYDNLIPNRFLNPGTTYDLAQKGASLLPGSKLVMIPNCGHFLQFEKYKVFNEEVILFLSK